MVMQSSPQIKTTIFVIDDDSRIRDALKWSLESARYKVEVFGSAKEFLASNYMNKIGCIIVDFYMPEINGIEFLEKVKIKNIKLPVIVLTCATEINIAVQAMKAGAVDFISKPVNYINLLNQLDLIIKNYLFLSNIPHVFDRKELLNTLTVRQNQILDLIFQGKLNKQISYIMNLSISTVEYHRSRLMKKVGAKNLTELITIFLDK